MYGIKIEVFTQWIREAQDFWLIGFVTHSCEEDWGFDMAILGFGISFRFYK